MLLRYPAYFQDFHCIAGACPDSCCKDWDVLVDQDTVQYYLSWQDQLGRDILSHMRQNADGDWYFIITDGRCPMWRPDGLCRIQAEVDHAALCQTCQDFPRLTHDYGNFVERGLELSCPEAAKLIFSGKTGWVETHNHGAEEPDYDPQDMELLLKTREVMLTILADTTRPIRETLTLALLYGYRAQDQLDGAEAASFDPEEELTFARSVAKPGDVEALRAFYLDLEILTDAWRQRLQNPAPSSNWDEGLRLLARYGVERYWLQAISDVDLVGRVKMVVAACILVAHLGGDLVRTAQLYAKEIENNDENVDAILDGAYSHRALTDEKLLGLLLI